MTAQTKLSNKNKEKKFVCVGLDTDIEILPKHILKLENPVLEFNKQIIENTAEYAAAYKLNFAFYEKDGDKGMQNLFQTVKLIPKDILIIADAKRGDIGNTAKMYAKEIFDFFNFDSVTLNPYMGKDSLDPFLSYHDKLNFILTLTSNQGALDFEKLKCEDGSFLFQKVIDKVSSWNLVKNCGLVFGATQLEDLKENLDRTDQMPLLIPGVGAQGGSFKDIVELLKTKPDKNYIVNVSRGIIYKSKEVDFAVAAKSEIIKYNKTFSEVLF